MRRPQAGFTIVELLIVIVVIAILAAISIVAYNGIQTRASNSQSVAALKQAVTAFSVYGTTNGDYPQVSGCIGEGYINNRCLSQNATAECFGLGASSANPSNINNALRTVTEGSLPSFSTKLVPCGATSYSGAYATYASATKTMTIYMILSGNQDCPSMSPNASTPVKTYSGDATLCRYSLAAIQ